MKKHHILLSILLLFSLSLTSSSCVQQSVRDNQYTFPSTSTAPTETAPLQTTKAPEPSTLDTFTAKVTRVLDGDTLEVRPSNNSVLKIRLQGIDAPESSQPFGDTARQKLTDFILNKTITIEPSTTDKYGRLIAKVKFNNDDICLKMISTGQAWWFKRYADSQSLSDRLSYSQAEDQSRQQQLGLWADPDSVPPWTYRHEQQQRQQD